MEKTSSECPLPIVWQRCPVQSDAYPVSIAFRSIDDTHIESNAFEIVKLRSSSAVLINCWVQLCWQKSKCPIHTCHEKLQQQYQHQRRKILSSGQQRAMVPVDSSTARDFFTFKEVTMRLTIEDPYGIQQLGDSSRAKNEAVPNVIGILCSYI